MEELAGFLPLSLQRFLDVIWNRVIDMNGQALGACASPVSTSVRHVLS